MILNNWPNIEPQENTVALKSSINEIINLYKLHLKSILVKQDDQLINQIFPSCSNKKDSAIVSTRTVKNDEFHFYKNLINDFNNNFAEIYCSSPKSNILVPPLDFSKLYQASKKNKHIFEKKRKSQPKHKPDSQLSPRTENSLKGYINQLLMIECISPQNSKSDRFDEENKKENKTKLKRSNSRSPGKINIIEGYRFKHTESIIIPLKKNSTALLI